MNISNELYILLLTAMSLGFFHTVLGPDHYLPFIVMSQSGRWSLRKTSLITFLCGLGHVLSSVLLGLGGAVLGTAITKLEIFEAVRGEMAAWALMTFGLVYTVWGIRRAIRNRPHRHFHSHGEDGKHEHEHVHHDEHVHVHAREAKKSFTPWALFIIFILGPCEPLIPVLMYPAAKAGIAEMVLVAGVFSVVTIATMMSIVLVSSFGVSFLPIKKIERYSHALAGITILLCGASIQFLGL